MKHRRRKSSAIPRIALKKRKKGWWKKPERYIPYTIVYLVIYGVYKGLLMFEGISLSTYSKPVISIPNFGGNTVMLSINTIIYLVATLILLKEVLRATKFDVKNNESDGPNSVFVFIIYIVLYVTTPFFMNELFITFVFLTFFDVFIGNFTIIRGNRKDTDIGLGN